MKTRYAPSPTGKLHIGGARTALFCYLLSKHNNGEFIVRLEDTDVERNIAEGEANQLTGLNWLGIKADHSPLNEDSFGPYRQSERTHIYEEHIQMLLDKGEAYECHCSPEELEVETNRQKEAGLAPKYSGKCKTNPEPTEGITPSIRLEVPAQWESYSWDDSVRGTIKIEAKDIGDWVIKRSNGMVTYNFANVIDDHLMEITHVIRGEEHISNTPKQIMLYKLFGWDIPTFMHPTIIVNDEGKKLSKRDTETVQFIEMFEELGYLPKAVFNYLALLGWAPSNENLEKEIFTHDELIKIFNETGFSKSSSTFDIQKLQWFNNMYLKAMNPTEFKTFISRWIEGVQMEEVALDKALNIFQASLHQAADISELLKMFTDAPKSLNEEDKALVESNKEMLEALRDRLLAVDTWNLETIKEVVSSIGTDFELKGKNLMMPIRLSLTGMHQTPNISEVIEIFGAEQIKQRI